MRGTRYAINVTSGGHQTLIDVGRDDGGDGLGPNPTVMAEAALAACSAITVKMYAARKKWPLDDIAVSVRRAAGEDAHASKVLEKVTKLSGDLDDKQRARLHEISGRCPVHRMLSGGVVINDRED